MQVSRGFWNSIADRVAADTAWLAAVAALKVHLVVAPFVPSIDLTDIGTLTLASFTGSAAKAAGIGTATVFNDPATGARVVQLLEPAGGWTWVCTADPAEPEVVCGYVVTLTNGTTIVGSTRLPADVTISASGQGFSLPDVRMLFNQQSPT